MTNGRRESFRIAIDILKALCDEQTLLQADLMKRCSINNHQCKKITKILLSMNWIKKNKNINNDARIRYEYEITDQGFNKISLLSQIINEFHKTAKDLFFKSENKHSNLY